MEFGDRFLFDIINIVHGSNSSNPSNFFIYYHSAYENLNHKIHILIINQL